MFMHLIAKLHILKKLKEKIDKFTIIGRDLNASLSVMIEYRNGKLVRIQKNLYNITIQKNLYSIINLLDLMTFTEHSTQQYRNIHIFQELMGHLSRYIIFWDIKSQ